MGFRYLSHHMRAANAQTSLCIHATSPEPLLLSYTKHKDKVSVRFVSVSINEHFRICDKYQNVVFWPISILFVCIFGVEVPSSVSGRVRGQEMA